MASDPHLLLLTGSGEARAVADALAKTGPRVTASQLCAPRLAGALPVPTRTGRFGDSGGFADFIATQGITAILDATHPFATRISAHAAQQAATAGLPHAQLLRPPWRATAEDRWIEVGDEASVGAHLQPGQRVFASTGRATLAALALSVPAQIFLRRIGEPGLASDMKNVTYVYDTGPFSVEKEIEVLTQLKIDVLVARNSGGTAPRSKLDAARALNLPVILIARPPKPDHLCLPDVASALAWVAAL
ncbi:MAG: precorrin-6A/cobalt-precorrin-6A reductase [Sedimentitalea sp.]